MSDEKIVDPVWNVSLIIILTILIIYFFSLYRRELKLNNEKSINPVQHVYEDKEKQKLQRILEEMEKLEMYAKQRLRKLEEKKEQ